MGPLGAGLIKAIPSIISAIGGMASNIFSNRSARKEYDRAREYNTPANQMKRFQDAGLSPWLMYNQGNAGNVTGAAPAKEYGGEFIGKGIDEYMSIANFEGNQRLMWADKHLKDQAYRIGMNTEESSRMDSERKVLEMYADFPQWIYDRMNSDMTRGVGDTSYRRKMNELKLAASKATTDRVDIAIQNMKYKNMVDAVRAKYAKDYGMVGGDWTQGLGLLKSLPNVFKKSGKAIPKGSTAPWNTTIKTHPILKSGRVQRRGSGFQKGGFTRP